MASQFVGHSGSKATRRLNTRPSHDLADYAGDYKHPAYGRITITHAEGKLNWRYRGMSEPLAHRHRHYDTFELPEALGRLLAGRLAISFPPTVTETLRVWQFRSSRPSKDIVFTRIPAGDCMSPAFRQHCTGTFSLGATTVVVGLDEDGQLTLTFGSQPTRILRPYQSRTSGIDKLEGFRVEFHLGPDGEMDELFFHQPNGKFLARRA
jgi:hypothetical protein